MNDGEHEWTQEEMRLLSETCQQHFLDTAQCREAPFKFSKTSCYLAQYSCVLASLRAEISVALPGETAQELADKVARQCQYWKALQAVHEAFAV
ncbi:MAG TPA: hypothetical protein VH593_14345 [Ktedonobacteraceae bacterium]|jgi:hypothetical protein